MAESFSINAFGWRPVLFLVCMAALPVGMTWGMMRLAGGTKAAGFSMVLLLLILPLFLGLFAQLFFVKATVKAGKLKVGGGLYALELPINELLVDQSRLHSAGRLPSLGLRTNGIGMPGLSLGWFRQPGGRKAFAAVASGSDAIVIPTSSGLDVFVSPERPEQFLDALRRGAAK